MRSILLTCSSVLLLSGCAETFLKEAESTTELAKISTNRTHHDIRTLQQGSQKAAALSYSYLNAANKVTTVQETSAGLAILSAGATAHGVAIGASDVTLTNRALPGIAATIVAARYGSQSSIQAIYAGAKRLNCISAKAGIANGLGDLKTQEDSAVAATRAAILDAQIITRTELVRNNPSFTGLFSEFTNGLGQIVSEEKDTAGTPALTRYIQELAVCLAISPVKTPENPPSGKNPDIPAQQAEEKLAETGQDSSVLEEG
ncbi:hypothetical protein [Leisingera sp. JC1]|uniref:hypothetical protein n=1 Tax=Leisingera sp. JC1 TaxID=1855282 RepID=UPI0011301DF0|nr:hypothetical protein [Leisingera sp. JC1]